MIRNIILAIIGYITIGIWTARDFYVYDTDVVQHEPMTDTSKWNPPTNGELFVVTMLWWLYWGWRLSRLLGKGLKRETPGQRKVRLAHLARMQKIHEQQEELKMLRNAMAGDLSDLERDILSARMKEIEGSSTEAVFGLGQISQQEHNRRKWERLERRDRDRERERDPIPKYPTQHSAHK